ncbi:hypothetical protein MMC14_007993 [Varicellaria rhodocarpa]|nr:hypothetical protein [Varicellaria rhodocarpa]
MINPLPTSAQSGFTNASSYDTHRPSYPPSAVSSLLQHLNLDNVLHARILEVGAGTGKFTELLARREEDYEILAVEPHEGMRKELERKELQGVKVVEGSAGDLGAVEEGWAEGVVVAQAFHWFANDQSLHQFYKVLASGGSLGLIWNIEDYNAPLSWTPSTKWEAKLKEVMWSFKDDNSRFRHEEWRKVFDDQLKTTPFTIQSADPLFSLPLGEDSEIFTYWLSKDDIWNRFHTISYIAILEGDDLETTKTRVFETMNGEDVETNEKGQLALHGRTVFCWTTAIPGASI